MAGCVFERVEKTTDRWLKRKTFAWVAFAYPGEEKELKKEAAASDSAGIGGKKTTL